MKVATKIEAERIAKAAAAKMAGYTFRPVPGTEFLPAEARNRFYVVKPDGTRYTVNAHSGTCDHQAAARRPLLCPIRRAGAGHGTGACRTRRETPVPHHR